MVWAPRYNWRNSIVLFSKYIYYDLLQVFFILSNKWPVCIYISNFIHLRSSWLLHVDYERYNWWFNEIVSLQRCLSLKKKKIWNNSNKTILRMIIFSNIYSITNLNCKYIIQYNIDGICILYIHVVDNYDNKL